MQIARRHRSLDGTDGGDAGVRYRLTHRMRASASAENILDERYIGLTSYNLPRGAPARGRTVYFSLRYE